MRGNNVLPADWPYPGSAMLTAKAVAEWLGILVYPRTVYTNLNSLFCKARQN
jgi:hypothetical protein